MEQKTNNNNPETAMNRNAQSLQGNVTEYIHWNVDLFALQEGKKILDIGCGSGLYFQEFMRLKPSLYTATDCSSEYISSFQEILRCHKNCEVGYIDLLEQSSLQDYLQKEYDYVICFDVLEHIDNHMQALKNIHLIMEKTGAGQLCLRVPALQLIYGINDEVIGHFRRYSLKKLKALLEDCGFVVDVISYQNILGVLPWFVIGRLLKRTLAVSSSEGKVFDTFVPVLKRIEQFFPVPFGLSLYCSCHIKK